jgi:cell division protein FtsI/penicillin-binding protein 2
METQGVIKRFTISQLYQLAEQARKASQTRGFSRLDCAEVQQAAEMLEVKLSERDELARSEDVGRSGLERAYEDVLEEAEYLVSILERHGMDVQVLENRRQPVAGA